MSLAVEMVSRIYRRVRTWMLLSISSSYGEFPVRVSSSLKAREHMRSAKPEQVCIDGTEVCRLHAARNVRRLCHLYISCDSGGITDVIVR